jgi:ketosteroid isomerase-like protein
MPNSPHERRQEADSRREGDPTSVAEENVEIVGRIYTEGLIDRDPKRLVDHFAAPDIDYVDPPDENDPGSWHGRTAVMRAMRRARQSFSEYQHELQELFDGGDTVVAAVSFHATTRARNHREEIHKEEAHVWTFRDGKIVRFEKGRDLKEALEAAGLSK